MEGRHSPSRSKHDQLSAVDAHAVTNNNFSGSSMPRPALAAVARNRTGRPAASRVGKPRLARSDSISRHAHRSAATGSVLAATIPSSKMPPRRNAGPPWHWAMTPSRTVKRSLFRMYG